MASAADVPSVYDLVLSGGSLSAPLGLVFLDALEPSLPFRTHRAIYSYTPTFIERQNVSGNFGDNQQDFFLTSSQRDWSEGEQQRFYRQTDQDSIRRYWQGTNVDVSEPGKAKLRALTSTVTTAAAPTAAAAAGAVSYFTTSTNLYKIASDKTITDLGAHGLGTAPTTLVSTTSGLFLYMASNQGASVGVRKYDVGGVAFTTFSATKAESLAFVNNTLYGWGGAVNVTGQFNRYDTAGTASNIFTFKGPDGSTWGSTGLILPFGGKIVLLRKSPGPAFADLYLYDGSGLSQIAQCPDDFIAESMAVAFGTIFVSGYSELRLGGTVKYRPTIYFYANGTIGKLWQADDYTSVSSHGPALAPLKGSLVFTDDYSGRLMSYSPDVGGISGIGSYTVTDQPPLLVGSITFALHARNSTTAYFYGDNAFSTSATLTTSLYDFDSSLTKAMRAITVEFDSATDGDGGSVDVAYRVGDVDGSYTSLATGITSGAENLISGVTGKSISVKLTLNKGTSTSGPVLKRISVRAAPIQTSFRMGEYVIDATGDGGRSPRTLRDGTPNPLSGSETMAQLEIAKASSTPLTIKDRRGTFTGYIETLEGYEEHPGNDDPTRSGEFVAKLIVRGI